MNQKVRTMLENMYELFIGKFNDSSESWDRFIEYIATDNYPPLFCMLNHKFEWLTKDKSLCDSITRIYDGKLLQSDFYDHLGEMYLEKIISKTEAKRRGAFHTPKNVADLMASITVPETDKRLNILDPAVGSGRLLMAAYKKAPNSVFWGVDIDLRALRIAYTNFAIHQIKGYLLHANSLAHEIDISKKEGRENWRYSNLWYSNIEKLKPSTTASISYANYTLPLEVKVNNDDNSNDI